MKLTEIQLQELKKREVEIFKGFISVCEKLNLKYYLLGGTLLGAVRHNGFIPWDDDIDVGMPREDYEIFLKKGHALLPDKYFIQTCHTDPEMPINFAKIRDSETTFIETSIRHLKVNHGLYIDIFPLDLYPCDQKEQKRFSFKKKLLDIRIAAAFYQPDKKRSLKLKAIQAFLHLLFPTYKRAIIAREKLYASVKRGVYLANYGGAWGVKEIVPVEWYGEGVELEFEGLRVIAPTEYDKWLTQVYGDYMTLPPIEKREPHHYVDAVDMDKSYTYYVK